MKSGLREIAGRQGILEEYDPQTGQLIHWKYTQTPATPLSVAINTTDIVPIDLDSNKTNEEQQLHRVLEEVKDLQSSLNAKLSQLNVLIHSHPSLIQPIS
jgi:hypothetical protein